MNVTKLKRVKRNKEKSWLKNYIDRNNKLGAKSTNDFEKFFLKV